MGGADQRPLCLHCLKATQQELSKSSCLLDLPEHRLHDLLSQSVPAAITGALQLLPHFLRHLAAHLARILDRSDSFQGRVANRCQIQLPLHFPQHRVWVDTFLDWWRRGFASWQRRAARNEDCIFLCELGPRDYAITDANGEELSARWSEALILREWATSCWADALELSGVPA